MITPALRRLITVFALNLICVTGALAQSAVTATWEGARAKLVNTRHKVYVVTVADATRRHVCRVDSINDSEIVCGHRGHTTSFQANDVAALILPGRHAPLHLSFASSLALGAVAMMGAGIFSLVCPACAVVSGTAALVFFAMAPATAFHTDDTLLYLAPGQSLQVNLD